MEEQTEEPQPPPPPPPLGWPLRNLEDELDDDEDEEDDKSVTPLEESLMELDLDMTGMEPLQEGEKDCV